MLPDLKQDDYDKVAKAYQEMSDNRSEQFDRTFSRVDKTSRWVVWLFGSIIGATFAVGVWWNDLSTSRNSQQKSIDALKIETINHKEILDTANQLILSNKSERTAQLLAITDRLRNYDEFIRKYGSIIDNMEFMRVHGVSFKEDFQRRNGFAAPNAEPPK